MLMSTYLALPTHTPSGLQRNDFRLEMVGWWGKFMPTIGSLKMFVYSTVQYINLPVHNVDTSSHIHGNHIKL